MISQSTLSEMSQCSLCENSRDLEFHHWDYEDDVGVELCRECHNYIHGGDEGRVSIQQNRVEYRGGNHWHELALRQLITRDLKCGGIRDAGIEPGQYNPHRSSEKEQWKSWAKKSWSRYKQHLEEKYNLPEYWSETASGPCGPSFDPYPAVFRVALRQGRI